MRKSRSKELTAESAENTENIIKSAKSVKSADRLAGWLVDEAATPDGGPDDEGRADQDDIFDDVLPL